MENLYENLNPFEYWLYGKDEIWIYKNIKLEPYRFVDGLLKRKFDNFRKRFPNKIEKTKACKRIAETNSILYERNEIDKKFYNELISTPEENTDNIFYKF
jgi:hypothetical protein